MGPKNDPKHIHPSPDLLPGPKETKTDRRIPLEKVVFTSPVDIPGATLGMTTLEAGIRRIVDGREWVSPPLFLDPVLRVIRVGPRSYPMEMVRYYDQARMAITRVPPPLDLPDYTIGKRTKSNDKV